MDYKILGEFTSAFNNEDHYSITRLTSNIAILNTKTELATILTHVDLLILYHSIGNFTFQASDNYYGSHNIENTPFTIDINGKFSLVIYKGTIDNFNKKFTCGSTSEDNIDFTSVPAWKIELINQKNQLLLGTAMEKSSKFLPYSTPILFHILLENIKDYLQEGTLCYL